MFKKKFENVDVLVTLNRILLKNTAYYRGDFEYDKWIIQKASAYKRAEDKTFLWMCRPCGTYCFAERDVFHNGAPANTTWTYYGRVHSEGILAFVIYLTGCKDGIIMGDIYPVNFKEHTKLVAQKAVPISEIEIMFDNEVRTFPYEEYVKQYWNIFAEYGSGKEFHYIPKEPEKLEALLQAFRSERRKAKKCSADSYIDALTERHS